MRAPSVLLLGIGLVGLLTACRGGDTGGVYVYNAAPSVSITSPTSATSVPEGQAVTFQGRVSDDGGLDALAIQWVSDLDGVLADGVTADVAGNVELTTASLTPGNHIITLQAVDAHAESGDDFVDIGVIDLPDAPTITAVHPAGGESGVEGTLFEFVAKLADAQDAGESLLLDLESDVDGWICTVNADATGIARCSDALSPGDHNLIFTATDLDGFTATAEQFFVVVPLTEIDNDGDGFTEAVGDCDDTDKHVYPSAPEIPNGYDDDCDGLIDEGTNTYDDDGDGFSELTGDCNDADPTIYGSASELVDGKDNNCNGKIDEGTNAYDDDGDGWTELQGDCDDTDRYAYLNATEAINGRDDDCDGSIDEGTAVYDDDGDGYCEAPPCINSSQSAIDCNDATPAISPAAVEVSDGVDNNCNGKVDEGGATYDDDGDGYSEVQGDCNDANPNISPAAKEVCDDGVDNNCNGILSEQDATGSTSYYQDHDKDGYGKPGTAKDFCSGGDGGEWDVTTLNDCDDADSRAHPGQTGFFTTPRSGVGGYDFNCSGGETKEATAAASCAMTLGDCLASPAGWKQGVAPACGLAAMWVEDCYLSWSLSCLPGYDGSQDKPNEVPDYNRTQACN